MAITEASKSNPDAAEDEQQPADPNQNTNAEQP